MSEMTVGCIRTTVIPQQSGIYEALLEKAERERDEARKESEEQARLLGKGSEREARLITERDHYKIFLESLLKSIDDWNDSMVKEPADDFIAAIAAYITEKLEK